MSETVAIEDLKIGMYIHLDMGWMAHPFPLSSFRIESAQEIARIRELGLRRLRWSPEKSAPGSDDDADADGHAHHAPAPAPAPDTEPGAGLGSTVQAAMAPLLPSAERLRAQRDAAAAQRAAARLCDQQYGEASEALRQALEQLPQQPRVARAQCERLAQTLLAKMIGEDDLCILVLASNAGERPSAHALNVTVISLLMARHFGFDAQEMRDLGVGALLHDIGKLALPHRVHHHDERMTAAEINAYRDHVRLGTQQGQAMGLAPGALQVIAQHHECADGSGFPARLAADRMGLGARIVALVNRFDNLCNPRQFGRALTPHEALSRLFTQQRGKVDATMLNAFIRMMGVYPAGSLVQLTDDRYALVTHVNSSRPLKPRVLVHDPVASAGEALSLNLADERDLGIRRSLTLAQLPEAARESLRPVPRVAYFFEVLRPPPGGRR